MPWSYTTGVLRARKSGPDRIRTDHPCNANAVLYQMSYGPLALKGLYHYLRASTEAPATWGVD